MLLTLTTTHQPATDLGYILHKHPARVQTFELPFGSAHVFYPEVTLERCTAALVLDVDPIGLMRGKNRVLSDTGLIAGYVNDRPYVASSFLSVTIARVYDSALAGKAREHAELVTTLLPLQATLAVVPCRGGESIVRELFEPLGYDVGTEAHPLDEMFPEWGTSSYYTVTLRATCTVRDLLTHLYVLIPVLDAEKHYFIGDDEVEKLLRFGAGWLAAHPAREKIAQRYLKKRHLIHSALARLVQEETVEEAEDEETAANAASEQQLETPLSLHDQRLGAVLAVLKQHNAHRVLDLGCGEGRLLSKLMDDKQFEHIVGMDVSHRSLEIAGRRLRLDSLPERQRARIQLLHGALTYRDKRLEGFDAAAIVEVIEHLDPARLAAFERVVFEFARPRLILITTPNAEYNVKFETLPAGKFRHGDHRFEWTRAEFETWATRVAERFGYAVHFLPLGPLDADVGAPSQMGIFILP